MHAAHKALEDDRKPGEITAAEYAKDNDMAPGKARAHLRTLVAAGVVVSRKALHRGNMNYYSFKKEE